MKERLKVLEPKSSENGGEPPAQNPDTKNDEGLEQDKASVLSHISHQNSSQNVSHLKDGETIKLEH